MDAPVHLGLAPKSTYMPAETTTGRPTGRISPKAIAECNAVLGGRYLSRDQVCVSKQTHEKIDNVSTKRNAVEQY